MGKGGGMRVVDINMDIQSVFCQIRYPDQSIGMPKWFLFFVAELRGCRYNC